MGCYGLSGAYGPVDKEQYKDVLQYAFESGVTLFDTAEAYGEDAERILGDALNPFRNEVHLSTKIKPPLSYQAVKESCKESLKRLQTDCLDIYFVHFDDPATPVDETIEALSDLRTEGKIKQYGISHLPPQRVEEYLEKGDVSFCMMELSAVARRSREKSLPLCRKHGAKAIAFSVTGRGILTGKFRKNEKFEKGDMRNLDPLFKKARFDSAMRITEKLKALGEKYDKTSTQIGINWVLSHENVISALTGPSSKEHLEENLGGSGWKMEDEDLEELEEFLEKEDEKLTEKESEIIKEILSNDLPEDEDKAFHDLIYAMEASMDQDMGEEKKMTPIAQELMSLRKSERGIEKKKLKEIQEKIKELVF